MRIGDVLAERRPCFSFEFYAPESDEGVERLMERVRALSALDPGFVSVTYGQAGAGRARTLELVRRIKHEHDLEVMAHVTCVDHTADELRAIFADLAADGIENVLALRGDPPRGQEQFVQREGGFRYASDLIELLRSEFGFDIGAAAYPEKHPEAETLAADIDAAVRKVRAGARFLITQLFFDNEYYFAYVAKARAAGIGVPIVPGLMPLTSYDQIARISKMCGATIPAGLLAELERRADEPQAVTDLGVAYCSLQCTDLLARGAPGVHFYTLNRSPATRAVVSAVQAGRAVGLDGTPKPGGNLEYTPPP